MDGAQLNAPTVEKLEIHFQTDEMEEFPTCWRGQGYQQAQRAQCFYRGTCSALRKLALLASYKSDRPLVRSNGKYVSSIVVQAVLTHTSCRQITEILEESRWGMRSNPPAITADAKHRSTAIKLSNASNASCADGTTARREVSFYDDDPTKEFRVMACKTLTMTKTFTPPDQRFNPLWVVEGSSKLDPHDDVSLKTFGPVDAALLIAMDPKEIRPLIRQREKIIIIKYSQKSSFLVHPFTRTPVAVSQEKAAQKPPPSSEQPRAPPHSESGPPNAPKDTKPESPGIQHAAGHGPEEPCNLYSDTTVALLWPQGILWWKM
ncbi:hypothetical protein V8E55_006725 [Tylopilus felleus]